MHIAWLALGGMLCSLQLSTGSFPRPLSPKEEQHYLERAAAGDLEARNVLVERNLRLVAHIMKKYYASESDQEDLISIGTIGLIKAVSSYKLDKNIRLATYASRCIENEILMHFRAGRKRAQDVSLSELIETGTDGAALELQDVVAGEEDRSVRWSACATASSDRKHGSSGRWPRASASAAATSPASKNGPWNGSGPSWRSRSILNIF